MGAYVNAVCSFLPLSTDNNVITSSCAVTLSLFVCFLWLYSSCQMVIPSRLMFLNCVCQKCKFYVNIYCKAILCFSVACVDLLYFWRIIRTPDSSEINDVIQDRNYLLILLHKQCLTCSDLFLCTQTTT